jgi:hypothetical protein
VETFRARTLVALMTGALLLSFGVLGGTLPSQAYESFPYYDAEAHCTELANFAGSDSASWDTACLSQEQEAFDALQAIWDKLPNDARKHCAEVARFVGNGSYSLLNACIKREVEPRGLHHQSQF